MFFASLKLISTSKLHLMITTWKYFVTILLQMILYLTLNVREFAFALIYPQARPITNFESFLKSFELILDEIHEELLS